MFNKEKLQRYSIRKLTVGAASVLVGISFMSLGTQKVNAATTGDDTTPEPDGGGDNRQPSHFAIAR